MTKRALVAMSGGVDSAVACALMKEAGYEVVGVTLRLLGDGVACGSYREAEIAAGVAENMGIPHRILNLEEAFQKEVIDRFVQAYEKGVTPNPCIFCNRYLKFGYLASYAKEHGFDTLVSGHYAKVDYQATTGRYRLLAAADATKDQSYVLYALGQEVLSMMAFPLGDYTKQQVREMAEARGFLNAKKPDSQDICFVPDGDYVSFLERETGKRYPGGAFVLKDGTPIGEHNGVVRYTVGQRKGLGIAWKEPLYVLSLDPQENKVTLGGNEDLFSHTLEAGDVNFVSLDTLSAPTHCTAKIRYRHKAEPCVAWMTENGTLKVVFDAPQRAITPGQSVVLYDGDAVIAGGIIL